MQACLEPQPCIGPNIPANETTCSRMSQHTTTCCNIVKPIEATRHSNRTTRCMQVPSQRPLHHFELQPTCVRACLGCGEAEKSERANLYSDFARASREWAALSGFSGILNLSRTCTCCRCTPLRSQAAGAYGAVRGIIACTTRHCAACDACFCGVARHAGSLAPCLVSSGWSLGVL